jgi:hypothetical protein
MIRVVLLAGLVAACCPELPPDGDAPPTTGEAIELVGELYALETGQHIEVAVRWYDPADDHRAGYTYGCADIRVRWDGVSRVGATVLAHEMAHCYAGDVNPTGCGGPGSDGHADPVWWGVTGRALVAESRLSRSGL